MENTLQNITITHPYELSYNDLEKFYLDKERYYLPLFESQGKDLFTFLSEQNDPDLKLKEVLETLFVRMCLSGRLIVTEEFIISEGRQYAKVLPNHKNIIS